jgi:hypothetical protein
LNKAAFLALIGTALLAVPSFFPASAHCPGEVPATKLTYPEPGVSIQEACYAGYGTCITDTFYTEKLLAQLVDQYKASKYSSFGYVKSVENYPVVDTGYYHGEVYYIDTFTTEKVSISLETDLKDSVPVRGLTLLDRWLAVRFTPLATTYTHMIDTPFVTFFNKYDSLSNLGLGPMDGCFFEPTAYQIYDGRIHKKGLVGFRMPGVSVKVEDFLAAIGHEPVPVPPVAIRPVARRRVFTARRPDAYRYDLMGRRLVLGREREPVVSVSPGSGRTRE